MRSSPGARTSASPPPSVGTGSTSMCDSRLRGEWASSDGAAGRMSASAGLHNLPSTMRPVVAAEPGHRIVRADLGQIELALAAVSGDRRLIDATRQDDLYAPIARALGVERDIAKVAVLGAMWRATGESAGRSPGCRRAIRLRWVCSRRLPSRQGREGCRYQRGSSSGCGPIRRPTETSTEPCRLRGTRPLCPQRCDPGRSGRILQGVGDHGPPSGSGARC